MSLLTINESKCVQCGICVDICPVSIISMNENGFPSLDEKKEKFCILCGHCESVCSASAFRHNDLPEAKEIQRDMLHEINSKNLAEYMQSRRSVRKFLPKTVDKTVLEKVFETVRYAPTGKNNQQNKWIVISKLGIIQQLNEAVIEWMRKMVATKNPLAKAIGFESLVHSYEQGNDVICRSGRNLIIGYTDANYSLGAIDTVIATSQMELMLPSFGLGGCWAGFVMMAMNYSAEVRKVVELDDSQAIHSALIIGYPKYRFSKIPPRKDVDVKWL